MGPMFGPSAAGGDDQWCTNQGRTGTEGPGFGNGRIEQRGSR
jgi:hypothetical protein